jgi:hypothetical protein
MVIMITLRGVYVSFETLHDRALLELWKVNNTQ